MRTSVPVRWLLIATLTAALGACAVRRVRPGGAPPPAFAAEGGSSATPVLAIPARPPGPSGVSITAYNRAVGRAQALEKDRAVAQVQALKLERGRRASVRRLGAALAEQERLRRQVAALRIERDAPQAQRPPRRSGKTTASAPTPPLGPVLGRKVAGRDGKEMGRIVDVLTNQLGRAGAVVIDFGGFLGVGTKKVAVAWSLLRFVPENPSQPVVLSLTRREIEAGPAYTSPTAIGRELVRSAASVVEPASAASVTRKPPAGPH